MHLRSVTTTLNKSGSYKLRAKWLSQIEIQCKQDSTCEFHKHVLKQKKTQVSLAHASTKGTSVQLLLSFAYHYKYFKYLYLLR